MTVAADNATLIGEGYEHFANGDVEGVLARFAPDIEWTIPGPGPLAGTYRGHAGVGDFFTRIGTAWTRLEVRVHELVADGDRVVALGRHVGAGPGGEFDVGFAHAWHVEDGLATTFYEYTDTATMARALG